MCISSLLQISEAFQDVEALYIPLSSHQYFQEAKPTSLAMILDCLLQLLCSSRDRV